MTVPAFNFHQHDYNQHSTTPQHDTPLAFLWNDCIFAHLNVRISGCTWSKNNPGSATMHPKAPMSWPHNDRAGEVKASGTFAIASSRIDQKQIVFHMAQKMPFYLKSWSTAIEQDRRNTTFS
jgi:hypothetical protein